MLSNETKDPSISRDTEAPERTSGRELSWVRRFFDSIQLQATLSDLGKSIAVSPERSDYLEYLAYQRFNAAFANQPFEYEPGQFVKDSEGQHAPKGFHSHEAALYAKNTVAILYVGRIGSFGQIELRFSDSFLPIDRPPVTQAIEKAHETIKERAKYSSERVQQNTLIENEAVAELERDLAAQGLQIIFLRAGHFAYTVGAIVKIDAGLPALPEVVKFSPDSKNYSRHDGPIGLLRGGANYSKGDSDLL